jgi:streptogramin lyase
MRRINQRSKPFFVTLLIAVGITWFPTSQVRADIIITDTSRRAKRYDSSQPQTFLSLIPPVSPLNPGLLQSPEGVAIGADRNIYIADATNGGRVAEYDGNTNKFIKDFVTPRLGGLNRPNGIVFGPDGNLYVSSALGIVKEYNGKTGGFIKNFAKLSARNASAEGLVFGSDGNLYVSAFNSLGPTSEVEKFKGTTGASLGIFVGNGSGGLKHPVGLFFGPNGDLFVSSAGDSQVKEYVGTTGAFARNFNRGGGLLSPAGLVFGPDGNLYVSSFATKQIKKYDGATGAFIGNFEDGNKPGSGGLNGPRYLAFTPVPEPSSIVLMIAGTLSLLCYSWQRKKTMGRRLHSNDAL